MPHDKAYLVDILESAKLIQQYVADRERAELDSDTILQDALCRRFEIIGEATKRLSPDFRNLHPHISWKEMAGMRGITMMTLI
jgi:uncharacterized protein with HEPN domain